MGRPRADVFATTELPIRWILSPARWDVTERRGQQEAFLDVGTPSLRNWGRLGCRSLHSSTSWRLCTGQDGEGGAGVVRPQFWAAAVDVTAWVVVSTGGVVSCRLPQWEEGEHRRPWLVESWTGPTGPG